MNKENSRSAAGLRRSAIAERIRLREEWSALKEVDNANNFKQNIITKKPGKLRCTPALSGRKNVQINTGSRKKEPKTMQVQNDALRGVVALVEVGSETRALPLRCALAALGATVVTEWTPLVTHLVWTDCGSRAIRAKARALACKLVSPLWVEACAASSSKLNERTFPAASRQSDLPSPKTLRQLLKKAEAENVPLVDLLSDSKDDEKECRPRLRISTDTEHDTSGTQDSSRETIDIESRVNTAPRRPLPEPSARHPPKSRRKLFTHKEGEVIGSSDDESDANTTRPPKLTQRERRDLARAERMAKKLLASCSKQTNNNNNVVIHTSQSHLKPKIVLTGMTRLERHVITKHIHQLQGFIQNTINKRTTHVLLGSCSTPLTCSNHPSNITGVETHCDLTKTTCWQDVTDKKARTCKALLGAARGCRVLHARWAVESAAAGKWLHHNGFEVQHLRKICQKARVERTALGRLHSEYAYDVFNGMRVLVKSDAEKRDAALELLNLCGAVVVQNGGEIQDGGQTQNDGQIQHGGNTQNGRQIENGGQLDVIIGSEMGEVHSKWVFDSVAAARMRTTRRYVNMNRFSQLCNEFEE